MAKGVKLEELREICRKGDVKSLIDQLKHLTKKQKDGLRSSQYLQHACAEGGSVECLKALSEQLNIGAKELNSKDSTGYSCLHSAVINSKGEMVRYLIEQGVEVNVLDNDMHSPLYHSVVQGDDVILKELIEAGTHVDTPDLFNATPLHYAVQVCDSERAETVRVVKLLLQNLQSLDQTDSEGRTALLWASSIGSHTAVQLLVKAGAGVTLPDSDGLTALHCAASQGHQKVIDVLVSESDCAVDSADLLGCTPLFYAASHAQLPALRQLLNYGADPNLQDKKGRTVSHFAAALADTHILLELEERGANLWIKSNKNEYPVHETLANQHSDSSFYLFDRADNSLDVNCTNKEGLSFLHLASKMGNQDLVNYLVDKSADVNAVYKTKNGVEVSALDICDERGHKACAELLQKYGAVSSRPRSGRFTLASRPSSSPPNRRIKFTGDVYSQHIRAPHGSKTAAHGQCSKPLPTPDQLYGENLARRSAFVYPHGQKNNVKKEVKIADHVDVFGMENTWSKQNQHIMLPELSGTTPQSARRPDALYGSTMLPYSRPKSASFVNVSSHIRRPKTAPSKKDGTQSIKQRIQQSVRSYNSVRKSARDVQEKYLKTPRPESARPAMPEHDRQRRSSTASSGHSTPSGDGSPTYTVIATRGGFTKIRDHSQRRKNDPELLSNLHQGKGNVGFTQGFDGRLRPRAGLVFDQPTPAGKT